jgi:hypothetical protein
MMSISFCFFKWNFKKPLFSPNNCKNEWIKNDQIAAAWRIKVKYRMNIIFYNKLKYRWKWTDFFFLTNLRGL